MDRESVCSNQQVSNQKSSKSEKKQEERGATSSGSQNKAQVKKQDVFTYDGKTQKFDKTTYFYID
ncbi:conserved hypothetical protein [Ricinus communis]|uniref:Uncharacterized protein n=1 Tax=Ricinus communis TaxID=3988 RepID=B9SEE5_RICCO|nr:conserved hypothetical protein [Ricinus communis]